MRLRKIGLAVLSSLIAFGGVGMVVMNDVTEVYADTVESDFVIEDGVLTKYKGEGGDVVIPDGVTSIGWGAFWDCSGLTSISIPNSVTSIGEDAFYGCSGLTSISIPNSVTSIGNQAFAKCKNLTSITIPNSVTSIGIGAFSDCTGLTSITIPNSVTCIDGVAFRGCTGLTSITIPKSVSSIGSSPFMECSNLTSIRVDNNNKMYDSRNNCNAIINSTTNELIAGCVITIIPDSVTSIGYAAFYNCKSLTNITIPDSVTSIDEAAFAGCTSLTSVTIPDSVTSIGDAAFWGTGLTSITIPNSVTSIGEHTFQECINLTSIIIPNSVTSIGESDFYYCENLTSITIPNSVTSIGESAFLGCSSLTSINIPDSVTTIGNGAFCGCRGLTSINIPDSVTSIGNAVFGYCDKLTSITIPNTVTSIGDYAFENCDCLTNITIPNTVTSIGDYAFAYCSRLTSITLPDSVTSIGNQVFFSCSLNNIYYYGSPKKWEEVYKYELSDKIKIYFIYVDNQPYPSTFYSGQKASFTVGAEHDGLTYQWQYSLDGKTWKNSSLASAKTSTYSFTAGMSDNMYVRCIVSCGTESLTTDEVYLTVLGIKEQPKSITVNAGSKASFSVNTNILNPVYQWQWSYDGKNWKDSGLASAKTSNYTFTASASDNMKVRCKIITDSATIYSNTVTCTVLSAPVISAQPVSASVAQGSKASFTVKATGSNLTYQWQYSYDNKTWKDSGLASAKTDNYSFTASAGDNNMYARCIVKNNVGSVTTSVAKLTVLSAPKITGQPTAQTVNVGGKASFTVTASGTGLSYQWQWSYDQKTWTSSSSSSAKTNNYSFVASTGDNNLYVRCIVKNSNGSVTSNAVKLTVTNAPVITSQPAAQTVSLGYKASFTVKATGSNLAYQWQWSYDQKTWNSSSSSSAKTNNYNFTTSSGDNNLYVRCIVKNGSGSVTSNSVMLTVLSTPVITSQPTAQTVSLGYKASFTVKATGSNLTYQWQWSYDQKTWNSSSSASAKTNNYNFTTSSGDNNLYVRCIVKNSNGTATSNAVKLTVNK